MQYTNIFNIKIKIDLYQKSQKAKFYMGQICQGCRSFAHLFKIEQNISYTSSCKILGQLYMGTCKNCAIKHQQTCQTACNNASQFKFMVLKVMHLSLVTMPRHPKAPPTKNPGGPHPLGPRRNRWAACVSRQSF